MTENLDLNKNELQKEMQEKISKELIESLQMYRKTLSCMLADAPLEVLCLSTRLQNALIASGCLRIYDLFDRDFTKIKGVGESGVRELTASLDKFGFM